MPAEIDAEFDRAIAAAKQNKEEELLDACHKIEAYFGLPKPNEIVKNAEVPGGMYSNMVANLRALNAEGKESGRSIAAFVQAVSAEDAVEDEQGAHGVGDGVVVDAENVEEEKEAYADVDQHHENSEPETHRFRCPWMISVF